MPKSQKKIRLQWGWALGGRISGAANGGPWGPGPHRNGVQMWSYAMPHTYFYCISLHIKGAKTDATTMQNSSVLPVIARWDEKLFSVKVRRSVIFPSKCTRNYMAVTMRPRIP